MTLTVTPSGQACGARIEGIDLTQDLTDSQIAELRQLWLEPVSYTHLTLPTKVYV